MAIKKDTTGYVIVAIIAIVAIIGIFLYTQRGEPTRLGEAVDDVSQGLEDAGRDLDPHRTTGEKIGEAVEDIGEDIQRKAE